MVEPTYTKMIQLIESGESSGEDQTEERSLRLVVRFASMVEVLEERKE